jgi:hypothetical protein
MLDDILIPNLSVQPLPRSETTLSSQFCLSPAFGKPSCIYTHEIISLTLAVAILVRAIRGSAGK